MNTEDEIFSYCLQFRDLEKVSHDTREYKLDRVKELLALAKHPELTFKTVHIAGSKGKGSTTAYLTHLFAAHPYRVGMYSSPHVFHWKERIQVWEGKKKLDIKTHLSNAFQYTKYCVSQLKDDRPSTFEILTLLAFITFREASCTWGMIEVGLGGRLDASNLIHPCYTIITSIELEHQKHLGNTIKHITQEKAGIIKSHVPIVIPSLAKIAHTVIKKTAQSHAAPLHYLSKYVRWHTDGISTRYSIIYKKYRKIIHSKLLMWGKYQIVNAGLALCIYLLEHKHIPAHVDCVLANTSLPGRSQLIPRTPALLLDGAHTPASIEEICKIFLKNFQKRGTLIIGLTKGKNIQAIAQSVRKFFSHVIISTAGADKPESPDLIAAFFQKENIKTEVYPRISHAINVAQSYRKPILITGSFHLIGAIPRTLLH